MNSTSTDSMQAKRDAMPRVRAEPAGPAGRFDLLRWFSLASLLAMTVVAAAFATLGARFMAIETLQRDALLTAQFVVNTLETETRHGGLAPGASLAEFLDPQVDPTRRGFTAAQVDAARFEFYDHIRRLPDQLLVNVFLPDRTITWSSNAKLVGQQQPANEKLGEAFASREMVARGYLERHLGGEEGRFLSEPKSHYVENYIPLRSASGEVAAVVEIYREPRDLPGIIERGERLVWMATALATLIVYLVTFGIVRRGHRLLMSQQKRLVDNETLVAIGELSTAIAHSLRNPLASIRSSAELALEEASPQARKSAADIVRQVDRMSRWIKDLLLFSRPQAAANEAVALRPLVADVLAGFAPQFAERGIAAANELPKGLPAVWGNRALLTHALQSVFANASEALDDSGRIVVSATHDGKRLSLRIGDNGRGMSQAQLDAAFRPFVTGKANGLGVGLPMVRQVMDRFGGEVELASREGVGTDVFLHFGTVSGTSGEVQ